MISQEKINSIHAKFNILKVEFSEPRRRIWAATEANSLGHGGLKAVAVLDVDEYPTGIKILDKEMADINIEKNTFHGEWNYSLQISNNQ
jgi:hypothetical protein